MRSFKYTIRIERSPAQVWAFMMDFTKAPRWHDHVREVRILTEGPLRVGTELQITFALPGRVHTTRCEVCAFETARRFGLRSVTKKATGTFEYLLAPDRGGTVVTFTCNLRPSGVMWLLLPLMVRTNRERFAEHLPGLKREVERSE
ncbi:MAG TPA: SRPBCC family protein [Vicinamibacterales bacterium]|nr:SRPBCC family protein [Vicinamibacterales bacterium]